MIAVPHTLGTVVGYSGAHHSTHENTLFDFLCFLLQIGTAGVGGGQSGTAMGLMDTLFCSAIPLYMKILTQPLKKTNTKAQMVGFFVWLVPCMEPPSLVHVNSFPCGWCCITIIISDRVNFTHLRLLFIHRKIICYPTIRKKAILNQYSVLYNVS